jgi:hypothetical protein
MEEMVRQQGVFTMNDLINTLISLSGDKNVVTVRKPFVQFTGSLEAGMMLSQLLYWTPKSETGWVAKTDAEFSDELCLSKYGVRKARTEMEKRGILKTKIKKFAGTPTVHYRLDLDVLNRKWTLWIRKMDFAKSKSPPSENEESITETTTEITPETTTSSSASPNGDEDAPESKVNSLEPQTESEKLLIDLVNVERKAKGYRNVTRFPSLACKKRLTKCSAGVNIREVNAAIVAALQQGIISLPKVVGYVESVLKNGRQGGRDGRTNTGQRGTNTVRRGITKEEGHKLRAHLREQKRKREAAANA